MEPAVPSLPVVWHEDYEVDIGAHVFPTQKYRLVRDRLVEERTITSGAITPPTPATEDDAGLVHSAEYLRKIKINSLTIEERLKLEVPASPELTNAMWLCAGGTALPGELALAHGVSVHLGGGFHHAFPDHGEGFCLMNDVAIAIRMLQRARTIERVTVVDLDVHHGNGTAATFAKDPSVFTFSMHQQDNYPAWKPPGDLDIGLADGTGDEEYLDTLDRHLGGVMEQHRPQLVFYLAGADPYQHDQLGGLGLTIGGLRRRDEMVLERAAAAGVPVAITLAGGYAVSPNDTVEIHCGTARAAASLSA